MEADTPVVGIVMGSDSDLDVMSRAAHVLEEFGVPFEISVLSAHRSPRLSAEYATSARARGLKTLICGAGRAAHLAGVMAAHTTLPVLGVPVDGGPLDGVDALYATVQMPPGIPVGTMSIGSHGATNAALFAVQILALGNDELAGKLANYREGLEQAVGAKNDRMHEQGWANYSA
ncbi:5-(carboxyamino)imidazole ribonucleotide mutase [Candidatus Poribacteria bacterium]|jgi:phosphoribosylaminoimidazole carboxylase PurE protein|nr:5-(carboxyamino)imidazole ribonucleotide mutase [Candidatus Poribacteria bacterium]MBT5534799.1 5-(carboxyamino)imidazole ribonucleotide mutase [Candidatus Poribacteria bacterium]MBT5714424.1 5-(carboxyamino)imidazole ribonucleotide mutase [Candidatus Poribacteria bacterium]MBT7100777.1 5-(carboxyamino)imidazole ribonucleotide mutase [Candidatus Poribacteria bacterium]MBT7807565.1 5-(carboxyamino)imidazole ribonucleotide mutase [Candidatus Poribacteria bacterium]